MKKIESIYLVAVLSLLILFAPSFTWAGEKINKKIDVAESGEVEINNNRGKIKVIGWEKNQIQVKGELDDLTDKFEFTTSKGKSIISVILRDKNVHTESGRGSNLQIYIPKSYPVQFSGVATDLDFSNLANGIYVNSVSGDIDIVNVKKRVYINIVSGDVDMKDVQANIEVSTVSGNVDINASSKKINVNAVSSDIVVRTDEILNAKLSTVSGDAKLYGKLGKDGEATLNNISGDSYFYVIGDLDAIVDLDTGPGGGVSNRYSKDKPTSSFVGSERLKFTAGAGGGLVKMSTVSGEIGLRPYKKRKK